MKQKKLKHYKPTRYRRHRKPLDARVLIIVVSALIMLGGSVALGSYLGSISEDIPADTSHVDDAYTPSVPYDKYPKLQVSRTGAEPLSYGGYTSDSEAERAVMKAAGTLLRSISVRLCDSAGVPFYKSEIYEKAYSAPSGKIDLSGFVSAAEKSSIEISAIFSFRSRNADYESIRAIRESYELGIIEEAYSLGVRELTLADIEARDADILYDIVCRVKERAPELKLGILIPPDAAALDDSFWAKLDDMFDFIALDFTEPFSLDTQSYPQGEWSAELQYKLAESLTANFFTLERYPSRVYIEIREECSHCVALARNILDSLELDSYIISLSEPQQTAEN